jgi:ABC-type multidrug transport system permease subunit
MGSAAQAVDYFAELGFPAKQHTNPSDHMIDLCSIDGRTFDAEVKSHRQLERLAEQYSESVWAKQNTQAAEQQLPHHQDANMLREKFYLTAGTEKPYLVREGSRFWILAGRNLLNQSRDLLLTVFRLLQAIVLALILGSFYFQLSADQHHIYDRQGALFFLAVQQSMAAMFLVINVFQGEKRIYHRERHQSLFGPLTFYLAKVMSEFPFLIFSPIVFTSIVYPMMNLREGWSYFFTCMGALTMVTFTSQAMGLLISAASATQEIANILTPIVMSLLLLFGGLFVNLESVPVYFRWIQYVNYIKYTYEILAYTDLNDLPLTCAPEDYAAFGNRKLLNICRP